MQTPLKTDTTLAVLRVNRGRRRVMCAKDDEHSVQTVQTTQKP